MIENTSGRDPVLHLLGAMGEGQVGGYIYELEAAGQAQLVSSDQLPTKLSGGTREELVEIGFTFGEPDPDDPLFLPVTLPEGWRKQAATTTCGPTSSTRTGASGLPSSTRPLFTIAGRICPF